MKIELRKVELEEKEILKNLIEKYEYEFSQWTNKGVNKLGLYGYKYLDFYWTEERRYPFFIMVDNELAGFVMIYFWNKIVEEYTNGDFRLVESYKETEFEDGTLGDVFFFDNRKVEV